MTYRAKTLLGIVLCAVALLICWTAMGDEPVASGNCGRNGDNLTWELTGVAPAYTLNIYGTGRMADFTTSNYAPWYNYRNDISGLKVANGVTSIGYYAFYNCSNLTSVTFGTQSNLESIGHSAFSDSGLTSITIPDSVELIEGDAFNACLNLENVMFGSASQLKRIDTGAFFHVRRMTSITLPASVEYIGTDAFGWLYLTSVVSLPSTPPTLDGGVFMNTDPAQFFVHGSAYKTASGWSGFKDKMTMISIVTLNDGITATGDSPVATDSAGSYYAEGTTLTLSGSDSGYCAIDTASKTNITKDVISGNVLTVPAADVTISKNISYTITFKVENGGWDADGSTGDQTLTLSRAESEDLALVLKKTDFPAVGSKPAKGYTAGSWDPAPPADQELVTESKTYTYKFQLMPSAVITADPQGKTLTYTGTEQELITAGSAEGGTMQYAIGTDNVTAPTSGWDAAIPKGKKAGTYYIWSQAVGDSTHNDSAVKYSRVAEIGKTDAAVVTAPTAKTLTYTGSAQELVTAGTAEGGTMQYAIGEDATTEPASGWSESIPTGTEAKNYYVWFKAVGDENHHDSKAAYVTSTIRGTISHTVIFKVVHGAWGDGTREDKTVIVTGFEGDELRLQLADIPKVDKPDEGYVFGTGKWSPYDPPVIYQGEVSGDPITEDMTFTYTYGEKTTQDVMVTLKVVHGEWGDELGGRDDRTIFLSGPIGAELRLAFDQIPDVTKPDEGYSMLTGSWDKQPSFILDGEPYGDPITEDTVYTYTYGEIPAAVITKAPVGKKLTYNGKAQELVSAGTAEGGTLVYALGNAKGATEKYTETIPAMINAGTYYVWYKAVGDKDHADTEPACVKAEITGGEEAVTFTRQLYRLVLNREPENLGYDAWVNALASGKTGAVQLIIGFFCSPEYQSQNHTVEDTVCRLYRVILNREPDPEGLQNWAQILAGGTPVTKVIQDMAQTDQFFALCAEYGVDPGIIRGGGEPLPETNPVKIRAYVTACYNGLLGRGPDKDGQESWANALQTGRKNAVQLIAGFMDSEEFKARNLGNGQVVEALYLAMLGRGADAGGLGHWRALLDAGYPVASVINGIANSNEFAAICQDCGIPAGQLPEGELPQQPVSEYTNEEAIRAFTERCYVAVLGRQGDAEGIDSHARMILSGKITPAQLIRSFITSVEFKAKLPGNEEYIKILYRAYLNREADADGLAFWLAKLNDGSVSPDQLLDEFENSAEFRAIDKALKNE